VRVGWADRPHVGGQVLHHGSRQPDAAPPGPGLADPERAQVVLGQTAQSLGVGWEKNKAVVLGDLAKAFIYQGDPEQAAAVLHQSIDLVERTRSAAGLRPVFKAGWQLRPWRHEPFVQDVQDRLLALGCVVPHQ
jgi:hypothetical protein